MSACSCPQMTGILPHTAADGRCLDNAQAGTKTHHAPTTKNRDLITHSSRSSQLKVERFIRFRSHFVSSIALLHQTLPDIMSNSWWTWAADVDAAIEEKEHQIENLKDQNKALLHQVECLDSEKDTLNTKVDWLYMMVNKMDSQNKALLQRVKCLESENDTLKTSATNMMMNKMDSLSSMVGNDGLKLPTMLPPPVTSSGPPSSSSGHSSATLALHGGYVHPEPQPLLQPQPPLCDALLHMAPPDPPTREHTQSLHTCVANGWHTGHFNEWLLSSQKNSGDDFQPQDPNCAISRYVQRLQTFTLPVAGMPEAKSKDAYTVLERAILTRVNDGAGFTCVKSTPSKCSGSTLIGCLRCGASLNLQHGYFGCDGLWDPTVITFLNDNTRDFWFSDDEQIKLGMEPGAPKAAHFCTAETMQPGCRMGSISV